MRPFIRCRENRRRAARDALHAAIADLTLWIEREHLGRGTQHVVYKVSASGRPDRARLARSPKEQRTDGVIRQIAPQFAIAARRNATRRNPGWLPLIFDDPRRKSVNSYRLSRSIRRWSRFGMRHAVLLPVSVHAPDSESASEFGYPSPQAVTHKHQLMKCGRDRVSHDVADDFDVIFQKRRL